jgi:hypothetical protein
MKITKANVLGTLVAGGVYFVFELLSNINGGLTCKVVISSFVKSFAFMFLLIIFDKLINKLIKRKK